MKKILLSLMVMFALVANANEYIINPSAVTRIDSQNPDAVLYDADATSWCCSQSAISGTSFKGYDGKNYPAQIVLVKFDLVELDGLTIQSATMSYNSKCTVSGKNSNVILTSMSNNWDAATVTWNSLDADVKPVQISAGTGQNVKTSTVNLKEDVFEAIKDESGNVVAFAIYTYTAREQQISDIKLTVEAIDASAAVDVKINYVCGSDIVKDATTVGTKGSAVVLSSDEKADFTINGVKYLYVSDNGADISAAEGSIVNVTVRKAEIYNYSIIGAEGLEVASGSDFEGSTVAAGYPHYQLIGSDLYMAGVTNKEYRTNITLDEDNKTANVSYNANKENVVFYSEAEVIEGLSVVTYGNVAVRASNALAAKATEDTEITTLAPGKYKVYAGVFSSAKEPAYVIKISLGNNTFEAPVTAVNASEVSSAELTICKESDLVLLAEGMGDNNALDYIYVQKTGDVTAKEILKATIDEANELSATLEGATKSTLDEAIDVAQAIYDNSEDAEVLETATTALNAAIEDAQSATSISSVSVATAKVAKAIENGKVVIVKNGKKISVAGVEL